MGAPLGPLYFHHNQVWFSGRDLFQVALRCPAFDHVPLKRLQDVFQEFAPQDLNPTRSYRPYWYKGRSYALEKLAPLTSFTGVCCRFCGQVSFPPGPRNVAPVDQESEWHRAQWACRDGWDRTGNRRTERLLCPIADELTARDRRFWLAEFLSFAAWSARRGAASWSFLPLYDSSKYRARCLWQWCNDCARDLFAPLNVAGHKRLGAPTTQDEDDARHLGRLSRMLSRRSYQGRLAQFSGNAVRYQECVADPKSYEIAEFEHWDPDVRAEWDKQDRLRRVAEEAAYKAFKDAYEAAEQAEVAA